MLGPTYGDIQAIIQEQYYGQRGLGRRVFGNQADIRRLEAVLKDQAPDALVSQAHLFEVMMLAREAIDQFECPHIEHSYDEIKTIKKTAHIQCCEALLYFITDQFTLMFTENEHQILREAILSGDVQCVTWFADMHSKLMWFYKHYEDKKEEQGKKRLVVFSRAQLFTPYFPEFNENLKLHLALDNELITRCLIEKPNAELYSALFRFPRALTEFIFKPANLKQIIHSLLMQEHHAMVLMLGCLYDSAKEEMLVSHYSSFVKLNAFYLAVFMETMRTGNQAAWNWLTSRYLKWTDEYKGKHFLRDMVLSEDHVVTLMEESQPVMLEQYIQFLKKLKNEQSSTRSGVAFVLFSPSKNEHDFCKNVFLSAIKQEKGVRVLKCAFDLIELKRDFIKIKHHGEIQAADTRAKQERWREAQIHGINFGLSQAAILNPSCFEDVQGEVLKDWMTTLSMSVSGELIKIAIEQQNSAAFLWLVSYEQAWFDVYVQHISESRRKENASYFCHQSVLKHLAESNKPHLSLLLMWIDHIGHHGLNDLFTFLMWDEKEKGLPFFSLTRNQKITVLNAMIVNFHPERVTKFFKHASSALGKLDVGLLMYFIKAFPQYNALMVEEKFVHDVFSRADKESKAWLLQRYPERIDELMAHGDFAVFLKTTEKGSLDDLNWLMAQCSPQIKLTLVDSVFPRFFDLALFRQSPDLLEWLRVNFPEVIALKLTTSHSLFELINTHHRNEDGGDSAALGFFRWFFDHFNVEVRPLMQANGVTHGVRRFFWVVVNAGDLDLLKRMAEWVPDGVLSEYLLNCLSAAFVKGHHEMVQWLLEEPDCLAYFDNIPILRFGEVVDAHLDIYIQQLYARRGEHEAELPDEPFDLASMREAKHAFYMIRALIRRSRGDVNDDILRDVAFLLSIPSVRLLAHQSIGRHPQENELYRFAMQNNCDSICGLLLEIDAVRALVERNDDYRDEETHGVHLKTLAVDEESSMVKLTEGERQVLNKVVGHYQPLIANASVAHYLNELRKDMVRLYDADPAKIITTTGEVLILPLAYDHFKLLELNSTDHQKALEAYYAHAIHGGFRFLSRPNPWIHPQAAFVNVNPNNINERWATDRHDHLIAVLYLAAIDTEMPCVRDYTPETKLTYFLHELALMNRAHNWYSDADGKEYENKQEADRPGCGPGAERRLSQSVPGNPLLNFLTRDLLRQVIGGFALNYFSEQCNQANIPLFFEVLNEVFLDDNTVRIAMLARLNIPEEKQAKLKQKLIDIYGDAFLPSLRKVFDDQFALSPDAPNVFKRYHAMTLSGISHLYEYLKKQNEALVLAKPSEQGLFAKEAVRAPDGVQAHVEAVKPRLGQ